VYNTTVYRALKVIHIESEIIKIRENYILLYTVGKFSFTSTIIYSLARSRDADG
jgi:hypothetical protein